MSAVSLEAVDRIIAAMCEGTNIKNLVPSDLDRAALARELEEIRETYEMRRILDDLSTKAQKKNSIEKLNASAVKFRSHLSVLLEGDPASVELIKHVARQDSRLAAQEVEPLKQRQAKIKHRLTNEQLEETTRTALLKELEEARAAERKRSDPYRDEPHFPAAALYRLGRDTDALIRWTEIMLRMNEAPEPEQGSIEESETGHMRFEGWWELPGDKTMRWLIACEIPRLLQDFFGLVARPSRGDTNTPTGPSIRFAEAVLTELGVFSTTTGKPLTRFGIEDHWLRKDASRKTPHQG